MTDIDREFQAMLTRGDFLTSARVTDQASDAVSEESEPLEFRSWGARFWLELGDDAAR